MNASTNGPKWSCCMSDNDYPNSSRRLLSFILFYVDARAESAELCVCVFFVNDVNVLPGKLLALYCNRSKKRTLAYKNNVMILHSYLWLLYRYDCDT